MPLQRHSSHSGSGWLLAPTASMPPPPPPQLPESMEEGQAACDAALHRCRNGLALGRCGRGLAFFLIEEQLICNN